MKIYIPADKHPLMNKDKKDLTPEEAKKRKELKQMQKELKKILPTARINIHIG